MIHLSHFDYLVEEDAPIYELVDAPSDEVQDRIGTVRVASRSARGAVRDTV